MPAAEVEPAAADRAPGRRRRSRALRIGLATGVVVTRRGDVFGTTVNLASRLTARGAPGLRARGRASPPTPLERLRGLPCCARSAPRAVRGIGIVRPVVLERAAESRQVPPAAGATGVAPRAADTPPCGGPRGREPEVGARRRRRPPPTSASGCHSLIEFVSLVSAARGYADLLRVMATEAPHGARGVDRLAVGLGARQRSACAPSSTTATSARTRSRTPLDEVYRLSEHPLARRMTHRGRRLRPAAIGDPGGRRRRSSGILRRGGEELLPRACPILFEGRVWGELWATRTSRPARSPRPTSTSPRLVAAQVGAGIAQAEHLARVERLAYTDDLTGLANRRAFEDRLDEALARAPRTTDVAVGRRGRRRQRAQAHQRPARPRRRRLRAAHVRRRARRPRHRRCRTALAARLGGDEFCLLTVGAPADEVVAARRGRLPARRRRARRGRRLRRGHDRRAAGRRCHARSRLLRAADAAQYRAKRSASASPGRRRPHGDRRPAQIGRRGASAERRQFRGRGSRRARARRSTRLLRRLDEPTTATRSRRLRRRRRGPRRDRRRRELVRVVPSRGQLGRRDAGAHASSGAARARCTTSSDTFDVDEYPATFAALTGRCVIVDVDDPRSDPAEVSLLMLGGLAEMVMCGGADARWRPLAGRGGR